MSADTWSYSTLLEHVRLGDIQTAAVTPDSLVRSIDTDGNVHVSQLLPTQVSSVMDNLASHGIDVGVVAMPTLNVLLTELSNALPFLFLVWFAFSMFKQSGVSSMFARMDPRGQSSGIMDVVDDVDTTFDDVAGLTAAKEELFEVVEYLRDPETFRQYGARVPKGVLLEGPPGTGKTLLARAVAGEANATFIPTTASSFVEMYVGLGAARVRALFQKARECAPCIVWIDEIDAVARRRSSRSGGGGNEERETTLNELLSAMDGFETETGVIVLAATNRADILDDALLRPGRFDRRVPVSLPDVTEREDILGVHSLNKNFDDEVDLSLIARLTPGFSGAQLSNVLNEAAIRTMRRKSNVTTMADINDAIERVTVGLAGQTRNVPLDVRERVAVHEAGHAIVGTVIDAYDDVLRVTIVPRSSGAGGFTSFVASEERDTEGLYTRDYLMAQLCVLLAGRAAEAHMLGEDTVSVGASSDIQRAQRLAQQMVVEWGMGTSLPPREARGASTLNRIDQEVETLMDEAYTLALSIVSSKRAQVLRLTRHLIDVTETVEGAFVRSLL